MAIFDKIIKEYFVEPIGRQVSNQLSEQNLEKKDKETGKVPALWDVPLTFQTQVGGKKTKKPNASVNFSILRQFAEYYPIARACINYLRSQITKLEWDIGSTDSDADIQQYDAQVAEVKEFFKSPAGHKTRLRELLSMMVEDVMVLDAVSLYKRQTFGGEFLHLLPIDAATIKLRVNDFGGTPEPPEIAYEQWIKGKKIAEMSTDDMIYEVLSSRTDNAYGRAPLESLVIEVESALQGALYNLKYLEEGNDPEGFGVLPEGWSLDQIREFQTYWDGLMTGNLGIRRRMRFVPPGFEYIPSKKAEDMSFEKFELWLLQKTCSVFGVPPQDIGFTYQVNKSTGEVQERMGRSRGLYPVANFIKEIFDDIIQIDMGFPELAWLWTDIDPVDEEQEIKILETEIKLGAKSVDEYRREKGDKEIGLGHYIMTPKGPVMVDDVIAGTSPLLNPTLMMPQEQEEDEQREEMKRWQKCAVADLKKGRKFRKFQSKEIDDDVYKEIEGYLEDVKEVWQIKKIFEPYMTREAKILSKVVGLRNEIDEIINAKTE